jgi:NADPH:quinone reductase
VNESIPAVMQAVQQDEPGGKLLLREVPVPRPAAGQVLVRMAASPINPSDLGALQGVSYRGQRPYPFTPGLEGSGTVVAAGPGLMAGYLKGRRVACFAPLTGNGTWAEFMVTAAGLCAPLNKDVSLEDGAMLLVNPLTALAFFEMARAGKHQAMVSTAAASALGGMITRLGRGHNIPIIHTVRRPEQVEMVRGRGAEHVLNSQEPDFGERLRGLAGQLRATLWLDAIGGQMTGQLAEAAPYGSTILLYGGLAQQNSTVSPFTALVKHLRIEGWFLANWLPQKNLIQTLRLTRRAQKLIADDLQSPVRVRLPLSAAQDGLEMYLAGMSAGKVLFVMGAGAGG